MGCVSTSPAVRFGVPTAEPDGQVFDWQPSKRLFEGLLGSEDRVVLPLLTQLLGRSLDFSTPESPRSFSASCCSEARCS